MPEQYIEDFKKHIEDFSEIKVQIAVMSTQMTVMKEAHEETKQFLRDDLKPFMKDMRGDITRLKEKEKNRNWYEKIAGGALIVALLKSFWGVFSK